MRFDRVGGLVLAAALAAGGAHAGGFSRGTADTDILFEKGDINFRAGAVIVVPSQKFTAPPAMNPDPGLVGMNYVDNYVIPSAAVKFKLAEGLACAGTFTDTNGAVASYTVPYGGSGKLSEQFTTREFGATCAAFFDVGPGRWAILGGAFLEEFDYSVTTATPSTLALEGTDYGWRAGIAYEIPDIALRGQLLYRSGTRYGATGTATSPVFLPLGDTSLPATGKGELPQSVELRLQSGIAPGWLAFGSIRWTDWSVNETFEVGIEGLPLQPPPNEYHWRDGWTVTAGIGHAFNDKVSGLVSLQWDRGVATGYDLRGEKWLLAGGAGIKDGFGGELRLGAGIAYLTAAQITKGPNAGAAVDPGLAGFLSAAYTVTW